VSSVFPPLRPTARAVCCCPSLLLLLVTGDSGAKCASSNALDMGLGGITGTFVSTSGVVGGVCAYRWCRWREEGILLRHNSFLRPSVIPIAAFF
jgi:hypothetical protein